MFPPLAGEHPLHYFCCPFFPAEPLPSLVVQQAFHLSLPQLKTPVRHCRFSADVFLEDI